jgi:hypothetical protein
MKPKAYLYLFIAIFVVNCALGGCNKAISNEAELKGDHYFYDESAGKVFTSESKNFDIKIEKWNYYYDASSSRNRILLSLTIKNKTDQELDDFDAVINLNPAAADLVASGILVYDQFEPCDLIPQKTANGASYAIDFLVESDSWLTEVHADKASLLDQIRSITLELTWSSGKETIELQLDPLAEP